MIGRLLMPGKLCYLMVLFMAAGSASFAGNDLSEKYRRWLDEEVVYIIAGQERREFLTRASDAERQAFILRFWAIRDPDTSTEENENRREHYQRIRYANEKFHDGKPGWKSERGRVYIMRGPPDDISFNFGGNPLYIDIENPTGIITGDSNPDRRRKFRLSFTAPETEIWLYRRLPDAENVPAYFQIIFSRTDPNQLYQLNQALRHLGGGGNLSYPHRLERDYAVMNFFRAQRVGGPFRVLYAGEYKFQDIDDFYESIFHPRRLPSASVTDLQLGLQDLERSPGDVLQQKLALKRQLRERVESRIFYRGFPLSFCFGSIRSDSGATLLPVTIGLAAGSEKETVDVLIDLVRADGQTVASVVDTVKIEPKAKPPAPHSVGEPEEFLYQARLAARPGQYRLLVYVRLRKKEAMAYLARDVRLPDFSGSDLAMSDVLLFQKVLPREERARLEKEIAALPRFLGGSSPIYLEQHVLVPASDNRFRRRDNLTAFFEVYNPGIPKDAAEPSLQVKCHLWSGELLMGSVPEKLLNYVSASKVNGSEFKHTTYGLSIPLRSFQPGEYRLQMEVFDQILKRNVSREASFTVY